MLPVKIMARKHKSEPATPTGHLTTVPSKTTDRRVIFELILICPTVLGDFR